MKRAEYKRGMKFRWNQAARPTVRFRAPIEARIGHGLGSARWNGLHRVI